MRQVASAVLFLGAALSVESSASARSVIKVPGAHPRYVLELEPHLIAGPFNAPGAAVDDGYGLGLRFSLPVAPRGFLAKVNDSVAVSFGADWVRYHAGDGPRGRCADMISGPNGVPICVEIDGGANEWDYVYLPATMQWNFWLTDQFSVFGEPGVSFYFEEDDDFGIQPFVLFFGGRWHFTDRGALTFRLGYPTLSLGVSFLL